MKQRWKNFMKIRKDNVVFGVGILTFVVIGYIGWYFSNLDLTSGNMGSWFAHTELLIYAIFTIAFTVFIAATVYQIRYFARVNGSSSTFSGKTSGIGGIGGIFGILVAGCPACSITVASYLGLASILSFLPRKGMELKALGTVLVIWSAWSTVKKLETCQMKIPGQERNVLLSYFTHINTSKILIILVALAGIAISVRAIKDYQEVKSTTANTASIVAELSAGTVPTNDVYVPAAAPSGGGCGGWELKVVDDELKVVDDEVVVERMQDEVVVDVDDRGNNDLKEDASDTHDDFIETDTKKKTSKNYKEKRVPFYYMV